MRNAEQHGLSNWFSGLQPICSNDVSKAKREQNCRRRFCASRELPRSSLEAALWEGIINRWWKLLLDNTTSTHESELGAREREMWKTHFFLSFFPQIAMQKIKSTAGVESCCTASLRRLVQVAIMHCASANSSSSCVCSIDGHTNHVLSSRTEKRNSENNCKIAKQFQQALALVARECEIIVIRIYGHFMAAATTPSWRLIDDDLSRSRVECQYS